MHDAYQRPPHRCIGYALRITDYASPRQLNLNPKETPMNIPITGLPGIGTARTATPREIISGNVHFAQFLPGLRTIDGSRSRDPLNGTDVDALRAGIVFGKVTSGGKYAPRILGVLGG